MAKLTGKSRSRYLSCCLARIDRLLFRNSVCMCVCEIKLGREKLSRRLNMVSGIKFYKVRILLLFSLFSLATCVAAYKCVGDQLEQYK